MAFGGLGGLGGSSFPMRFGAPNSQNVAYMPNANEWRTDWQQRYDTEMAKQPVWKEQNVFQSGVGWEEGLAEPGVPGAMPISAPAGPAPLGTVEPVYESHWEGGPDPAILAALEAERTSFLPLMENQVRQQKAYDVMRGTGTENAMITPAYMRPGFGEINSEFGQDKMGADAKGVPGIDNTWTGAFGAMQGATGLFGAPAMSSRRWGL